MFHLLNRGGVRQSASVYLNYIMLTLPLLRYNIESYFSVLLMDAMWDKAMKSIIEFSIKVCCKNVFKSLSYYTGSCSPGIYFKILNFALSC